MSQGWDDEPRWLRVIADPRLFAGACAWLIVLTVLGTLAQRDLGLYQAQERYFTDWFLWLGALPLPGGRLTLSLAGLGLLAALFTRRSARHPGLALLHGGTVVLLAGCMAGAALRQEGTLALGEGERGAAMDSWLHHELALRCQDPPRLVTIGEGLLRAGEPLAVREVPLALRVVAHHRNARPSDDGGIEMLAPSTQAEANQAGLILALPDGREVALCEGGATRQLAPGVQATLRRIVTPLPFELELLSFRMERHPGTGLPRHFAAEVTVREGGTTRRVVISMNQPLRIGAWTAYLQSWGEGFGGSLTAQFAIAHDRFQLSPYIASAIMLLGLLWHLVRRMRRAEAP